MANIEKRSNNSYRITVSCGYDSVGKKIRNYKTIAIPEGMTDRQREKELQKQAVLFEREVENGTYLDGDKLTLAEFIHIWFRDYADRELAPKTVERYSELSRRIIQSLGNLKLCKIQPPHIVEFINTISENGVCNDGKEGTLSSRTVLHHFRLLHTILNTAVQWNIIVSNPAERVKPPKVEQKQANSLNDDDVARMIALLESQPLKYQTAVYIAVLGGLRMGEALGA